MVKKELIKKRFLTIDKNESVSKLIGDFIRTGQKTALVYDKKRYIGVSDKNLLLRTKLNPAQMKISKCIKKVPALTGKEDNAEVARLLFTAETRLLPVIDKGKVVGVIRTIDLINELGKEDLRKKISEVMTIQPIVIGENDRVGKAIEIMKEEKVSRIPIVDKKRELLGITSFTDVLSQYLVRQQGKGETRGRGGLTRKGSSTIRSYEAEKMDLHAYPIKNLTSNTIITASPDDKVSKIIDLMNKYNISSIVLVEGRSPVGIITARDLLKLFLKDQVTF